MQQAVQIVEFIVQGRPASVNWKDRGHTQRLNYSKYKDRVAKSAKPSLASDFEPVTEDVEVQIYYFYSGVDRRDIDNIVKPILDGLGGEENKPVIWVKDDVVARIVAQRFSRSDNLTVENPPVSSLMHSVMTRTLCMCG